MAIDPDKIKGMFTGVMLGDVIGSPVEGWSRQQVAEKYGQITGLLPGSCTTDDWQLTVVVSDALRVSALDMDAHAAAHVAAMQRSSARWGGTTKAAVRLLAAGTRWSESGQVLGIGNGVVMKLSPVAAAYADVAGAEREQVEKFAIDLTRMTHRNRLAVAASLAHINALAYCLTTQPARFRRAEFIELVVAGAKRADSLTPPDPVQFDNIADRLAELKHFARCGPARLSRELRGDGYVRNSLPFGYAHFLRHPHSVEALLDVVSSGEDADTNGSIVGALLGALNGQAVFPAHLLEDVRERLRVAVVNSVERLAQMLAV